MFKELEYDVSGTWEYIQAYLKGWGKARPMSDENFGIMTIEPLGNGNFGVKYIPLEVEENGK